MKVFAPLLLVLCFSVTQAQSIFIRSYGGPGDFDRFLHATEALGGGYIFAGLNTSFGAASDRDGILMKTDPAGNPIWSYNYGTSAKNEYFQSIWQAPDSSIYAFGTQTQTGKREFLLLAKFDPSGQFLWDKMIGGMGGSDHDEQARKIIGYDNHIYLFGSARNLPNMAESNPYIVKLDMAGNKVWAFGYGGNEEEQIRSTVLGANGNFFSSGFIESIGAGSNDFMMCEVDTAGSLQWMKSFGTSADEWSDANLQLSDGTLMAAGFQSTNGQRDIYVIRTSATGTLLWAKTFGGAGDEHCYSMSELPNGYIACVGYSNSFGSGDDNALILIIDKQGQVIKAVTYGGSMDDAVFSSTVLADQTLLCSGWSDSPGYTQGLDDFLVIKTSTGVTTEKFCPHQLVTGLIQDSLITVQVDSTSRTVASYQERGVVLDHVAVSPAVEAICLRITSISAEKLPEIIIYPNPAQNILTLSTEKIQFKKLSYTVFDVSGRSIMEGNLNSNGTPFQLDVSHLPKGIFLLTVKNEDGTTWNGKWIKD